MPNETLHDNVLPFVRPLRDAVLAKWELDALDEGMENLDRHMEAISSGSIEDLDGPAGFIRLAWRSRNRRLIRLWQATGGPAGDFFAG